MKVCRKCKSENEDWKLRCGSCGQVLSTRGDYAGKSGPEVVVHGSVEDYKRAVAQGDIEPTKSDEAFGAWMDATSDAPIKPGGAKAPTRKVSIDDLAKVTGLRDISKFADLLKEDAETAETIKKLEAQGPPPALPTETPRTPTPVQATDTRRAQRPFEPARPGTDRHPKPGVAPTPVQDPLALTGDAVPTPLRLDMTGQKWILGRDRDAQVPLDGAAVSRRHAQLTVDEKGEAWVEDLRSRNGTYVNGCAIQRRRLQDGDRLDVGGFSLRVRRASSLPPARDPMAETGVLDAVPGALTGEIEANGLLPIVALLHATRRHGVLTLRAERQVGRIFFSEGEIVHALLGKALGEEALAALLRAEAGKLHFQDERIKLTRSIARATDEIIADVAG